jgi:hypothetical protein
MTTRISEVIHRWLGYEAVVPSIGGSFKDRTIHWLSLFRNRIILLTIGTFCAGLYMFASLGSWSNPNLFIIGILVGLSISAIVGIWYWRIFNEVLHDGPVVLWNQDNKTSRILTIVTVVVFICIPVLILQINVIPGVDLTKINAFFGGFIAVLFWGQLIGIWIWESGTHHQLHYDGMILKLAKDDKYSTSKSNFQIKN